jgi:hypothetical protein
MYIYGMQHWWPFCIGFRGQHRAIPDASPRDISYPDPNDDADIDVPDQQALMDAFIAGLAKESDFDF